MTTKGRMQSFDRPLRGYRRRGEDVNFAFMRALAVSLIVLGIWTMWMAVRIG